MCILGISRYFCNEYRLIPLERKVSQPRFERLRLKYKPESLGYKSLLVIRHISCVVYVIVTAKYISKYITSNVTGI